MHVYPVKGNKVLSILQPPVHPGHPYVDGGAVQGRGGIINRLMWIVKERRAPHRISESSHIIIIIVYCYACILDPSVPACCCCCLEWKGLARRYQIDIYLLSHPKGGSDQLLSTWTQIEIRPNVIINWDSTHTRYNHGDNLYTLGLIFQALDEDEGGAQEADDNIIIRQ